MQTIFGLPNKDRKVDYIAKAYDYYLFTLNIELSKRYKYGLKCNKCASFNYL